MAKILIVEDEPIPRRILATVLGRDGHDVRSVATAAEARDVSASFGPQVLVADWLLPDGTGSQVAEYLRASNGGLPVIFISGLPVHHIEADLTRLHPYLFFEKPFRFADLRKAVRETAEHLPRVTDSNS